MLDSEDVKHTRGGSVVGAALGGFDQVTRALHTLSVSFKHNCNHGASNMKLALAKCSVSQPGGLTVAQDSELLTSAPTADNYVILTTHDQTTAAEGSASISASRVVSRCC